MTYEWTTLLVLLPL